MKLIRITFGFLMLAGVLPVLRADVTLPAIISDHMVLQKTKSAAIWGKADAGEEVTVLFARKTGKTKADPAGKWTVRLDLTDVGSEAQVMTIEGKNRLTISDVVVGEVWVASGQSNMERLLKETKDAEKEIASSANSQLRQFKVQKASSMEAQDDCEGQWVLSEPGTAGDFSAVGYYFGKVIQRELQTPVGIISDNWGGSACEAWISPQSLDTVPGLRETRERHWKRIRDKKAFAIELGNWLKERGRDDRVSASAIAFSGPDLPTGDWISISLPGPALGGNLPSHGAVWLRRDIDISKDEAGKALRVSLEKLNGYETVYWNGKQLDQTKYEERPNPEASRAYDIPPNLVKAGNNTLALRVFAPLHPIKLTGELKAGSLSLAGKWLAKAEFALPSVAEADVPPLPANPMGANKTASLLYNAMISPILPFSIRGVIWYQGEANADRAFQYRTVFPQLIADWRKQWKQGDFPFYFCQLANFKNKRSEPSESAWAELREAQAMALQLPNTGQAVLIDLGEAGDIHPRNKADVGERLARIALARDYGRPAAFSGPTFADLKVEGSNAIVTFSQAAGGLVAKELPPTFDVKSATGATAPLVRNSPQSEVEGFAVCGEDRKWVWANAKIVGDSVVVSAEGVPHPVAVRYAWADNPTCNLHNGAGLPASPFRTDDFPETTRKSTY